MSKVWIWLIIVGVIGVVFYVIYNYNLKLFNFRGSIWYFSFMGFLDGTLWQKLMGVQCGAFGYSYTGTDCESRLLCRVELAVLYCSQRSVGISGYHGGIWRSMQALMYVLPFVMYTKGKERKPEKAAVLAALVGYLGQGLFTGPYILTYVLYTIFLGVLGAYCRMGKEKEEQKHEYSAMLVCALGTDQRIKERKYARVFWEFCGAVCIR